MEQDEGIKHENKTVGTDGEPSQRNNPRYPISIFIPQTVIEEYRANEKCNRANEKRRYCLETIALLVAAVYAAVTIGLWVTARSTEKRAAQEFWATQRPYMTIGRADGVFMEWRTLEPNRIGVIRIYFQNTGNSVAQDFHVWAWVSIGLGQVKLPLNPTELSHPVYNWPIPKLEPRHGIETPVTNTVGAHSVWIDNAYSQRVLSKTIVDAIDNTDIPVSIYGFYEYSDGQGNYRCEPIHAEYTSGKGVWILQGFTLSQDPFTKSLCRGHNHHE